MSTSEMRRGPGWWMDLDGEWKPPQQWPESTPPLPGWTRNADGLWSSESLQNISVSEPDTETAEIIDLTDRRTGGESIPAPKVDDGLGLSYSTEAVANPDAVNAPQQALPKRALMSAIAAAIIAVMLGTGIVLLILL